MKPEFYLDHNATTPLLPEVREHMARALETLWGNPSSLHWAGRAARKALEEARERVAVCLSVRHEEIVFTSGGTEADHLAIRGALQSEAVAGRRHMVASAIEHPAVLECCRRLEEEGYAVSWVAPDCEGVVQPESVEAALRSDTALVSVMAANNEVGSVQPIARIAELTRSRGILFHTDAVQALGKTPGVLPGEWGVDLASFSAHKIGGPKGAGALYVRRGLKPMPQQRGGPQERQLRGGTENTAAIVGFALAAELLGKGADGAHGAHVDSGGQEGRDGETAMREIAHLRDSLQEALIARIPGLSVNASGAPRLCNTLSVVLPGCPSDLLVMALDMRGIAVSAGSACSSGSVKRSHVLLAMGKSPDAAGSSLRFSLGQGNTLESIPAIAESVAQVAEAVRGS